MAAKDRPFTRFAALALYGQAGADRLDRGECPRCGAAVDPDEFTDERSRKEFMITGLCQKCQVEIF